MKMGMVSTEFEARAADALKALFTRISAIKLIELKREPQPVDGVGTILAHPAGISATWLARIEIYGHIHTLACQLSSGGEPIQLHAALRERQIGSASEIAGEIPVVIAPYLSLAAQAFCKQHKIGYLDFEGNARLTVGDFFIVMRSLPRNPAARISVAARESLERSSAEIIFPGALPKVAKQPPFALSA